VKLAVPVSSVTTFDYWIRTDRNWDWHQRPPGIRRIADIGTLLALHAPNPLLVVSSKRGTDDEEFPLDEAEKSFRWAKHVYRLLGAEAAVTHYESTTAHGYQEDKRHQLYLAVERWLRPPHPRDGKEIPAKIESAEDLRCSLPENNLTFRDVYGEWLKPLPRTNPTNNPGALRAFLRERLGWPQTLPQVKAEKVGQEKSDLWSAEFWVIETEPGIRLPAVRIVRNTVDASRNNRVLTPALSSVEEERGKNLWSVGSGTITLVPGRDKQAVARALDRGQSVLAFDLRGLGEMRHGNNGTWPWMAGPPWSALLAGVAGDLSNWAWFAGRPWSGQWALDLVQVARFCQEQFGAAAVSVDAENEFGWPTLLAGAAAPEHLASGSVRIPWASLREVVQARGDDSLADVPGLLERLDVPQLRTLWPAGKVSVMP